MRAISLHIPPARRILDFGCGTGWVLTEAQTAGNPLRFGVDNSLAALRGTIGGPQPHQGGEHLRTELVAGDGTKLPFSDESFDVIVGHVSMPYMNTRAALREIYRVLAPGGSLFLTFHSFLFSRRCLLDALRRGAYREVARSVYIAINGLLNHFSLPQTQAWWDNGDFETVNTQRGVSSAARKEGFVMISTERAAGRIFFATTARKLNARTGAVLPAPGWAAYCELKRSEPVLRHDAKGAGI